MDLLEFGQKVSLHGQAMVSEAKDVVAAVKTFLKAKDEITLAAVRTTYDSWMLTKSNKQDLQIYRDMEEAIALAPGQYFKELFKVIDPASHPRWEPEMWIGSLLTRKNCYAYACNDISGCAEGKQDPGEIFNQRRNQSDLELAEWNVNDKNVHRRVNEAAVIAAIEADNIIRLEDTSPLIKKCEGETKNIPGHYLVALIVSAKDYHWFRQDRTGYWSQKSGHDKPTNKWADGSLITKPGALKEWGSEYAGVHFYHMPKEGVSTLISEGKFLNNARKILREKYRVSPTSSPAGSRRVSRSNHGASDDEYIECHSEESKQDGPE